MSVRNLEALFAPASVAVIGVSERPGNLGMVVWRNLQAGGFKGPVWLVDHRTAPSRASRTWPDVDVASRHAGPGRDLHARGHGARLVAALGAQGHPRRHRADRRAEAAGALADGSTLEQAMLDAARPYLLRILGPNCLGLLVPGVGLNASFAPGNALPGKLAFVTQSGALATAMLDWANSSGIGFSHFISLGDSADVDFGDVLDYLASDPGTRAILMYMESVKSARKFMSAARAAARNKPVIVVKAGRAPAGAKAAASHTGALAGSDAVFDAAVRRAGMLRVDTLESLFDAAETLAHVKPWRGERLAILTNGGGAGVLAADALALGDGRMAELGEATLARARPVPARDLAARQPGGHHRRRPGRALQRRAARAARGAGGRRRAVHARAHGHRAGRGHRRRLPAAHQAGEQAGAGLLAGRQRRRARRARRSTKRA